MTTTEELEQKSVKELKTFLEDRCIDYSGCLEKSELLSLAISMKDRPILRKQPVEDTNSPNDPPPYSYPTDELPSANAYHQPQSEPSPEINFDKPKRGGGINLGKGGGGGAPGKPLETDFYDFLGVPVDAEPSQIKKAYYKKAMIWHPDKNPSSEAEAKFKEISEAYQILMDPDTRAAYDRYGKEGLEPAAGFVDPKMFFSILFGGGKFEEYIGTLEMAGAASEAADQESFDQNPQGPGHPMFSQENPERVARINTLTELLRERIVKWKENPESLKAEVNELVEESFGYQLLGVIGYVYEKKAKTFVGKHRLLGVPGFFSRVGDVSHLAKETFTLLKAGTVEANAINRDMQQLENTEISPEQRQLLEQELTNKVLNIIWAMNRVDIENVLRNVCENIFLDETVPLDKRIETAKLVQSLGAMLLDVSKKKLQAVEKQQKQERLEKRRAERAERAKTQSAAKTQPKA